MNRMERDIVDCIYQCLVLGVRCCITTVALERKVAPNKDELDFIKIRPVDSLSIFLLDIPSKCELGEDK